MLELKREEWGFELEILVGGSDLFSWECYRFCFLEIFFGCVFLLFFCIVNLRV